MTRLEQAIVNSDLSNRTKKIYLDAVRAFLAHCGGAWSSNMANASVMANAWYKALAKRTSIRTANTALSGVQFAARTCGLSFVEAVERKHPEIEPERARILTPAEGRHLLAACGESQRDRTLIIYGLWSGLRRQDLIETPMSLDLNPLDARVAFEVDLLAEDLRHRGIKSGPLFRSMIHDAVGPGLTADGYYKILQSLAKKARIEGVTPNALRATAGAWGQEHVADKLRLSDPHGRV